MMELKVKTTVGSSFVIEILRRPAWRAGLLPQHVTLA
jgi:hypothetical protein